MFPMFVHHTPGVSRARCTVSLPRERVLAAGVHLGFERSYIFLKASALIGNTRPGVIAHVSTVLRNLMWSCSNEMYHFDRPRAVFCEDQQLTGNRRLVRLLCLL